MSGIDKQGNHETFSIASDKIKGSSIHYMSEFDEVELSDIDKFQIVGQQIDGFSDISSISNGKLGKPSKSKLYNGSSTMPDD